MMGPTGWHKTIFFFLDNESIEMSVLKFCFIFNTVSKKKKKNFMDTISQSQFQTYYEIFTLPFCFQDTVFA